MKSLSRALVLALGFLFCSGIAIAADKATGSLDYKGRGAEFKYAWLVTGPSDFDAGTTIRRIVLSSTDIGAELKSCTTFSCTDGVVSEGMTADFTGGPRIEYWVVMNDQMIQYSGTAMPATFTASADDPGHLAGTLAIDDSAAGGPKITAVFDVTVLKDFKLAR